MATLNEIAYNIKNLAYGGSATINEESINTKQIKFWIHYYRAQMLRELSTDGRGVPHECYQSLNPSQDSDVHYPVSSWATYLDDYTSDSRYMLAFSSRSADEAQYPDGQTRPQIGSVKIFMEEIFIICILMTKQEIME